MNREIKFRAWCSGTHGNIAFNKSTMDYDVTIQNGAWCNVEATWDIQGVYPTIPLMQYIGKKDKNGKDIYEGDIVEEEVETEYGKDKIKHEVTFNAGAFYPICMQPSTTFKIIGNVYEHPELMSGSHAV